jgi:hypothetical protein
MFAAAGLVADAPCERNSGAQPFVADLVVDEPGFELAPGGLGKHVAEQDLAHVPAHRARTGCVAVVSRRRLVQTRLVAVEPGHRIAERTGKLGKARWSADRL